MNFITCFDVVSMVVDEATERFAPLWRVDNERYDVLRQYCEALDQVAAEFDGESFEVEVDEIKMTIAITMTCSDLTVQSASHVLYQLGERALSLRFNTTAEGDLAVTLTFPSVWEKTA
jgi:hypothetical protein